MMAHELLPTNRTKLKPRDQNRRQSQADTVNRLKAMKKQQNARVALSGSFSFRKLASHDSASTAHPEPQEEERVRFHYRIHSDHIKGSSSER